MSDTDDEDGVASPSVNESEGADESDDENVTDGGNDESELLPNDSANEPDGGLLIVLCTMIDIPVCNTSRRNTITFSLFTGQHDPSTSVAPQCM